MNWQKSSEGEFLKTLLQKVLHLEGVTPDPAHPRGAAEAYAFQLQEVVGIKDDNCETLWLRSKALRCGALLEK